jgi:hypothetical protein
MDKQRFVEMSLLSRGGCGFRMMGDSGGVNDDARGS